MKQRVKIDGWQCVCVAEGCKRNREPWFSLGKRPPLQCPTCRSREWDGPKRQPKISLPKPPRVRGTEEEDF